jgi:hypothetical protein
MQNDGFGGGRPEKYLSTPGEARFKIFELQFR